VRSNDQAGTMGALLIVTGLAGAGVAGWLLKTYKQYARTLRVTVGLCAGAVLLFVCALRPHFFSGLLAAAALLGPSSVYPSSVCV
jgi:uncharacterized membrane protein YeaQ/YmgE (transglycosylase-associated protein family)